MDGWHNRRWSQGLCGSGSSTTVGAGSVLLSVSPATVCKEKTHNSLFAGQAPVEVSHCEWGGPPATPLLIKSATPPYWVPHLTPRSGTILDLPMHDSSVMVSHPSQSLLALSSSPAKWPANGNPAPWISPPALHHRTGRMSFDAACRSACLFHLPPQCHL